MSRLTYSSFKNNMNIDANTLMNNHINQLINSSSAPNLLTNNPKSSVPNSNAGGLSSSPNINNIRPPVNHNSLTHYLMNSNASHSLTNLNDRVHEGNNNNNYLHNNKLNEFGSSVNNDQQGQGFNLMASHNRAHQNENNNFMNNFNPYNNNNSYNNNSEGPSNLNVNHNFNLNELKLQVLSGSHSHSSQLASLASLASNNSSTPTSNSQPLQTNSTPASGSNANQFANNNISNSNMMMNLKRAGNKRSSLLAFNNSFNNGNNVPPNVSDYPYYPTESNHFLNSGAVAGNENELNLNPNKKHLSDLAYYLTQELSKQNNNESGNYSYNNHQGRSFPNGSYIPYSNSNGLNNNPPPSGKEPSLANSFNSFNNNSYFPMSENNQGSLTRNVYSNPNFNNLNLLSTTSNEINFSYDGNSRLSTPHDSPLIKPRSHSPPSLSSLSLPVLEVANALSLISSTTSPKASAQNKSSVNSSNHSSRVYSTSRIVSASLTEAELTYLAHEKVMCKSGRKGVTQMKILKSFYSLQPRPSKDDFIDLAQLSGLSNREISRWFRNERYKLKQQENATQDPDKIKDEKDHDQEGADMDSDVEHKNTASENESSHPASNKKAKVDNADLSDSLENSSSDGGSSKHKSGKVNKVGSKKKSKPSNPAHPSKPKSITKPLQSEESAEPVKVDKILTTTGPQGNFTNAPPVEEPQHDSSPANDKLSTGSFPPTTSNVDLLKNHSLLASLLNTSTDNNNEGDNVNVNDAPITITRDLLFNFLLRFSSSGNELINRRRLLQELVNSVDEVDFMVLDEALNKRKSHFNNDNFKFNSLNNNAKSISSPASLSTNLRSKTTKSSRNSSAATDDNGSTIGCFSSSASSSSLATVTPQTPEPQELNCGSTELNPSNISKKEKGLMNNADTSNQKLDLTLTVE